MMGVFIPLLPLFIRSCKYLPYLFAAFPFQYPWLYPQVHILDLLIFLKLQAISIDESVDKARLLSWQTHQFWLRLVIMLFQQFMQFLYQTLVKTLLGFV